MVIQCSSCDTRFKIADDKVKNGPVKVRCSKCKEIFTVQPPEDEQAAPVEAAPEPAAPETDNDSSPSLDDVDWGSLNSDESDTPAAETPPAEEPAPAADEASETSDGISDDAFSFGDDDESTSTDDEFSFGDDEEAAEESAEFSFGDEETVAAAPDEDETGGDDFSFDEQETGAIGADDFAFGDDAAEPEESDDAEDDAFSFGGDSAAATDDFGFDEPVGEGAQDEFSFDDAPAATGDADDFDWDGSGGDTDSDDGLGFGDSDQSDGNLDFSSLEMAEEEEAPVEIEEPSMQEAAPAAEDVRPPSVKGPQKSGAKGRKGGKRKKAKKKSGPLRGILMLLLFFALVIGGGLFGLKQMGFWSGDIEELQTVDYVTAAKTAWEKGITEFNNLVGNKSGNQSFGEITVTEMAGKYSQNKNAGTLFVIDGKIRNDFNSNRSAIAVKGILYDAAGSPVQEKKVYCGNVINNKTLQSATLSELETLSSNVFGDRFSNEDVAPGAALAFTIVFSDLPDNLSTYNVEVVESALGSAL